MAEMPDLIPPAGALQPSTVIPYDHGQTGRNRPDPLSAPTKNAASPQTRTDRAVYERWVIIKLCYY